MDFGPSEKRQRDEEAHHESRLHTDKRRRFDDSLMDQLMQLSRTLKTEEHLKMLQRCLLEDSEDQQPQTSSDH